MGSRDIIILSVLFMTLYFEVFLLITYLGSHKTLYARKKEPSDTLPDFPAVTIVVPCYNEEGTAAKTIHSLLALDYPADKLKIMAVNDGSTDGTAAMLETFRSNPRIEVIHKENGGKHTALNIAIERATTPFIGCLDADSYASPDSLKRIMKRFADPAVMAVVPSLHIHNPETVIQRLQKVEYLFGIFVRSILAELDALYVTPGPFSIFRTSVFRQVGPYKKAHNTEDMEMALRMQAHKMKISCANDAVVYTSSPRTIRKLYKQRVRWTSGFLHNARDYRSMLLNPSFGHVGGFILPFLIVSTGTVFFTAGVLLYSFAESIREAIIRFDALGLRALEWTWPAFDWFYMHSGPVLIIGAISLCVALSLVFIGTSLSRGNRPSLFDLACSFLYMFIAPFWIIRSIANFTFSRQVSWR